MGGLDRARFASVLRLEPGFHRLEPSPSSGALDWLRHPGLSMARGSRWRALQRRELAGVLRRLLAGHDRLLVFGEPYIGKPGVHNVHVNQGDPPGSPWAAENGPWQDGGLVVVGDDGYLAALLMRFDDQAHQTDARGRAKVT
jgi:hypothetical protein